MLTISDAKGVIFDVDETLLDNLENKPTTGLHNRARYKATLEVGREHGLHQLENLTLEENHQGFIDAPVHSIDAAAWHTLYMKGVVATDVMDPNDPILREIIEKKTETYEALLRNEGRAYPGAVEFVQWVASCGLKDFLAIASTALRRDIDIFLEMSGLTSYFPSDHIISLRDLTHAKPNPEAFDKAFLSLGLPESARSKVIAFEDNPRGIMSAKGAGLFTCAITNAHPREELRSGIVAPDLIADTFDEFRQLLTPARS